MVGICDLSDDPPASCGGTEAPAVAGTDAPMVGGTAAPAAATDGPVGGTPSLSPSPAPGTVPTSAPADDAVVQVGAGPTTDAPVASPTATEGPVSSPVTQPSTPTFTPTVTSSSFYPTKGGKGYHPNLWIRHSSKSKGKGKGKGGRKKWSKYSWDSGKGKGKSVYRHDPYTGHHRPPRPYHLYHQGSPKIRTTPQNVEPRSDEAERFNKLLNEEKVKALEAGGNRH